MFTFADQEQEFNRALRKEREEGELTGERRGAIREAITIYDNELDLSPSEIITKIMNRFSLTKESAEQYVESTLGHGANATVCYRVFPFLSDVI